jgi:hypothetical protein
MKGKYMEKTTERDKERIETETSARTNRKGRTKNKVRSLYLL